jgi:uncharacterized membrane protein YkoI
MWTSSFLVKMNKVIQASIKFPKRRQPMKINRFIALAVIALLVIGAMGVISMKVFARSSSTTTAQTQPCDQEDEDSAEAPETADTEDIEEQCGDQNKANEQEGVEDTVAVPVGVTVITSEQAETIAITAYPGTVTLTELENENGQLIYTVEFKDGGEVEIDAVSGTVLVTDSEQD